jgi:hypothetical protein
MNLEPGDDLAFVGSEDGFDGGDTCGIFSDEGKVGFPGGEGFGGDVHFIGVALGNLEFNLVTYGSRHDLQFQGVAILIFNRAGPDFEPGFVSGGVKALVDFAFSGKEPDGWNINYGIGQLTSTTTTLTAGLALPTGDDSGEGSTDLLQS